MIGIALGITFFIFGMLIMYNFYMIEKELDMHRQVIVLIAEILTNVREEDLLYEREMETD